MLSTNTSWGRGSRTRRGDAVGDGCVGRSRRRDTPRVKSAAPEQLVFPVHHAHIDTGPAAHERGPGVSGILHGLPDGLQKQPLLGVDLRCIAGRNVEEQRIEQIHVFQEPAPFPRPTSGLASLSEIPVVPAGRRDLHNAIAAFMQIRPKRVEIRSLRIASAQADDGDALLSFLPRSWPKR